MKDKKFETKLHEKQDYGTGATRDNASGKGRFDLVPDLALARLAGVFERGANNHGARNWEKGLPLSRLVDSALRHMIQYKMSRYMPELGDEDHLAHAAWNIFAIMHEEGMIERGSLPKELDDLPRYPKLPEEPAAIDKKPGNGASEHVVVPDGDKIFLVTSEGKNVSLTYGENGTCFMEEVEAAEGE